METITNREMLRYHVSHNIFCKGCQHVMDVRAAASIDILDKNLMLLATYCYCVTCWDKRSTAVRQTAQETGYILTVLDGRQLYPVKRKRNSKHRPQQPAAADSK